LLKNGLIRGKKKHGSARRCGGELGGKRARSVERKQKGRKEIVVKKRESARSEARQTENKRPRKALTRGVWRKIENVAK